MISNQLAIAALAGTCVAAAAGGGYLAARQNAASAAGREAQAAEIAAPAGAPQPLIEDQGEPKPNEALAPPAPPAVPVAAVRPRAERASVAASAAPRPVSPPVPVARAAPAPAPAASVPAPPAPPPPVAAERPVLEARVAQEALPRTWQQAPPPEEAEFREVTVPADSVIGLEITATVSSETAAPEDRVEARVVRDVLAAGQVAIPAGTRAIGSVTVVERGGRIREQAQLGIRFHTLRLPDGSEVPVSTEAIYRLGNAPGKASAAKIGGGAVAGAILGGILGGSKGAAIGASSGAGAGTAVVYAGDRSEATFTSGLEVTARFLADVTVPVDR